MSAIPAGRRSLDLDALPGYLFSRGLLAPDAVVHGKVEIHDRSRRNRNFRVLAPGGASLLVKQAGDADEARGRRMVAAEGAVLRAFAEDPAYARAAARAPRFVLADEASDVLVTELIHPATTMTKLHLRGGRPEFPPEAARAAGRLLADVHAAPAPAFLPDAPPGPLTLRTDPPPADPAMAQLAEAIRGRPFFEAPRDDLLAAWRKANGLVHHDVRWDNLLVQAGADPEGGPPLRLIDWETAGRGDPAWDVACYLGEHVRFWLSAAMLAGARDLADARARAGLPFGWPEAGRAFWEAYAARREPEDGFLARVVRLAPFHLLLQAFEMTNLQPRMPGAALAALELADAWHADPDACARGWLGL